MNNKLVVGLASVGIGDVKTVGGKNASLGEMLQHLTKLGVNIPNGFVVTVQAYREFISFNHLDLKIQNFISDIDYDNLESLKNAGKQVRQLITSAEFPACMRDMIIEAYHTLSREYQQDCTDVAVRSSATAEDLPDASFAGQQESFLNVRGAAALMDAVRNCFASVFTDRVISYRKSFGYDDLDIGLSVCVQKMVRSDLGASGVAFSLDTESGFKDAIVINGSYGLGELVVQGAVCPDEFVVFKPLLMKGYAAIIEKKLGVKDKMMVYGEDAERVRIVAADESLQRKYCMNDEQILQLSRWIAQIETYYSDLRGKWTPMDIEWALDGSNQQLFIVQARPETIHSRKEHGKICVYKMKDVRQERKIILKGIAVGDGIGSGKVRVVSGLDEKLFNGAEFMEGDVLVTEMTDPNWEPIMKRASAIITDKGGRTCHAAIVARELGVPAVVGCNNATASLQTGQLITVNCSEGEQGVIYSGYIPFSKHEYDLADLPETKTPIMLNVASPASCFKYAHLPARGVGLARVEFIINNYIQIHPLALMNHKQLNDEVLSRKIHQAIAGYENEESFFIHKFSYGIAKIASAFYPHKVIVRFSDFKSNEYLNLLGGAHFEPTEENPMLGWRGASRYYSDAYKAAFGWECKALKLVREKMGLKNVVVMIPFCRTPNELLKVLRVMEEFGLKRGQDQLEVYLMAELPSNIIRANEFAQHIDGFSIGSNDLTQLVLGLDRDSSLVAHLYDERDEAVKFMISDLIKAAKANNVKVGICGQAPSDFPEFAQFLVCQGIDTISVTPDSFLKTVMAVASIEQEEHVVR